MTTTTTTTTTTTATTPDYDEIVRVVQLYIDGFKGDVDKFKEAFHEDAWIFFHRCRWGSPQRSPRRPFREVGRRQSTHQSPCHFCDAGGGCGQCPPRVRQYHRPVGLLC